MNCQARADLYTITNLYYIIIVQKEGKLQAAHHNKLTPPALDIDLSLSEATLESKYAHRLSVYFDLHGFSITLQINRVDSQREGHPNSCCFARL